MTLILKIAAVALTATGILSAQGRTLRDQVRSPHEGILSGINMEIPPRGLATLASESTLIVHGTIARTHSYLSSDETSIYTDYAIDVSRAIGQWVSTTTSTPRTLTNLVLKHLGGTVTLEGQQVSIVHDEVPPFKETEEYVMFLTYNTKEHRYLLTAGQWAVFQVRGNKITPLESAKGYHRQYDGWGVQAFLTEVERLRSLPRQ